MSQDISFKEFKRREVKIMSNWPLGVKMKVVVATIFFLQHWFESLYYINLIIS